MRTIGATTLGAAVLAVAPLAPPAGAATIVVTTTADGGPGSLRDAFAQASVAVEATEIVLDPATYVLDDCAEGDLAHTGTQPLTIRGRGAVIRQQCAGERVIATDGDLTVLDTNIGGGTLAAGIGGGIEADTADVALVRSEVVGNQAPIGGGVAAIRVELVDSTVSGNVAGSVGGGIWADQVATLLGSTVHGNDAGTSGGGVVVVNGAAELVFATVTANGAPVGANVELQAGSDELVSFGSVVAQAAGGPDCTVDAGATITSQGGNADGDGTCGFGAGVDDRPAVGDPGLDVLRDNGGRTATRLPLAAGPLVDAVDCAAAPLVVMGDQRGIARPQGPRCDIGAAELLVVDEPPVPGPAPTDPVAPPSAPPAVPVPGAARFTG